jgi:cytochrome c553
MTMMAPGKRSARGFVVLFALATFRVAPVFAADQAPPMPDISTLHGKELVENACGDCHGVNGISEDTESPKLAGQTESYLRLQMLAFKNGTRHAEAMNDPRFTAVTRAQIDELARYYSRLPMVPDKVEDKDKGELGLGAFVYRNGRPRVPPCASCHGPDGTGGPGAGGGMMGGGMMMRMRVDPAEVPNLAGQHADYTLNQMNAFASGARPSPVMGPLAAGLSARDRKAVALYLAGLK